MKRKIKIFLLSLLFVFSTAIISACGESQVQVAFKVGGPYSMTVNQEVSLQELVEVSDGEIGDVVFCSSNEDILYITPSQTIIARSEGEAILTVKDSEATLTIVVSGLSLQFDAPTNLSYNETLNRIVWNAMYL